jgi:hypothetical protein
LATKKKNIKKIRFLAKKWQHWQQIDKIVYRKRFLVAKVKRVWQHVANFWQHWQQLRDYGINIFIH